MEIKKIYVATEFTEFPGARYKTDGDFSGQDFFEKFLDNTESVDKIEIYLDGTYGYPSSFLSEAFGSYYKKYKEEGRNKLELHSDEDPSLIDFINYLAKKDEK